MTELHNPMIFVVKNFSNLNWIFYPSCSFVHSINCENSVGWIQAFVGCHTGCEKSYIRWSSVGFRVIKQDKLIVVGVTIKLCSNYIFKPNFHLIFNTYNSHWTFFVKDLLTILENSFPQAPWQSGFPEWIQYYFRHYC